MEEIDLPPDLVDALRSVHWKVATYASSLPLPVAELHAMHGRGGDVDWFGIARTDWAILRVWDPDGVECLPVNSGELRPGCRVEFVCRTKASITAVPWCSEDLDTLEDMSVGDALPADIKVTCLSLSGMPTGAACEDMILEGSRLLGRVADRYIFEYEPLERLRRNFGVVSELPDASSLDLYRFGDGLLGTHVLGQDAADGTPGLNLDRKHNFHILAVISYHGHVRQTASGSSFQSEGEQWRGRADSLVSTTSIASKREVCQLQQKWRLTWSPPASFRVMQGDLCIMSCAEKDLARQAGELFSGHATVETNCAAKLLSPEAAPVMEWMVALVFENPTSDKCPRRTVTEQDAKDIFKQSFKPVVAGQNRAEYLRLRWHRFRSAFRGLPEESGTHTKSFLDLALRRTPSFVEGGKPYSCAGKQPRLPHIPCGERRTCRVARPRCFLELLQQTIIDELVEDCGLLVEPCYSEDKEKIILLISCSKDTLLREAEHQRFYAELDLQAVDPESLEPCSFEFEPLLHQFLGGLSHESGPEASVLLEQYQAVVEAIETEWADASDAFKARFQRARAFWLAGGMHESSIYWDDWERTAKNSLWNRFRRSSLRRAAFVEYMSLRAEWGLGPHSRLLMREASARVQRQRCQRLMKLLRLWSPMVETWSCVLRNHWDRFAGGMKHGRAMAFCSKRPGMDWTAFRTFSAKTLNTKEGVVDIPFCSKDRLLLLLSILNRGLFVEELLHGGTILDFIALDSAEKDEALGRIWKLPENASLLRKTLWFVRGLLEPPPTDEINHYYSSRIAFYFELTKFLITQLFPLGLLGLVLQLFGAVNGTSRSRSHVNMVGLSASDTVNFLYAVVTPFWVIIVLSLWRRRQAWLVTHWGRSAQAVHPVRPAFWGVHRRSPTAVGEFEISFPTLYRGGIVGRFPRQVVSCCVLLLLVAVEFWCAIPITMIRRDLRSHLLGLALPLLMQVFGYIGYQVARRLNEWENYPTSSAFIGSLAFKISVFEFLNRYGILFYIAFLKSFWEGCIVSKNRFVEACGFDKSDCEMCKEELQEYVVLVLVSSVALSSTQLMLPLVWNLSFRQMCEAAWAILRGARRQEAVCEKSLDADRRMAHTVKLITDCQTFGDAEVDGSFDDYLQVFVLFGYAALFSVAFPAAPLVVAFAMMVELRVDGVKIYNLLRRPFPIPANGLESWMSIFQGLVVCAVVANAGLAVWTFRFLGGEDESSRWIRFLAVMVCTTVLISITQLAPCFTIMSSSLPMQRRTAYIVDNMLDSSHGSPSNRRRSSAAPKRFYSCREDLTSCTSSDTLESSTQEQDSVCHEDIVVSIGCLGCALGASWVHALCTSSALPTGGL